MYFKPNTSSLDILRWFQTQLSVVNPIAKNGLDVELKPHKQQRSNEQNRFFMVIGEWEIIETDSAYLRSLVGEL